jgi:hypothetical protein
MVDRKYSIPSGLFGRINETRAAGGTRVFERPMHVLERIDEVRVEKRRNGTNAVAILKTVVHVFGCPDFWADGKKGNNVPMPKPRVGDQFTEYFTLDKDWAWASLKTAVGSFFGTDPDLVTDEIVERAAGEGQPCAGIIMESRKIERAAKDEKSSVVYTRCGYVRPWTATEVAPLIQDDEKAVAAYGGMEKLTADVEAEAAADAAK